MARMYRKSEWEIAPQPAIVTTAERTLPPPGLSPAKALQELLEQRTAPQQVEAARWSRRRSLALIVTSAASMWLALLAMAHGIASAFA